MKYEGMGDYHGDEDEIYYQELNIKAEREAWELEELDDSATYAYPIISGIHPIAPE